jgi:hypothetical protein
MSGIKNIFVAGINGNIINDNEITEMSCELNFNVDIVSSSLSVELFELLLVNWVVFDDFGITCFALE